MRVVCFAALLVLPCVALHAAGFDCTRAQSAREKTVCASPKLSALDAKLATEYTAELRQLSSAAAAEVQADQRQWLGFIDAVCAKAADADMPGCLEEHYGTRVDQLTPGKGVLRVGSQLFFTRGYFMAMPESAKDIADQQRFGGTAHPTDYGEFAWPELDRPTEAEAKWNRAIAAHALEVQGSPTPPDSKTAPHSFRGSVAGGSSFGFWTLNATNQRMIGISLGISTYGWGAAHPLTGVSNSNWWLSEARPLAPADVFRGGSEWKTQLALLVLAALLKDPGAAALWRGKELTQEIAGELDKPRAWELTRSGLTIDYGQYEVGPYSSGMPAATIAWRTIMPLLNPSLLPETLPAALVSPER